VDVQRLDAAQVPTPGNAAPVPVVHAAEGGRLDVSPGGHLSGPGTGKSDSIDAKVATGEFVVNAEDTAKNLPLLHDINSGKSPEGHFASGGTVTPPAAPDDLRGNFSVTYDPDSGGAFVNGNLIRPGNPILNNPQIAAAIARSKADMDQKPTSHSKGDDPFGGQSQNVFGAGLDKTFGGQQAFGGVAEGGVVGDDPQSTTGTLSAHGNSPSSGRSAPRQAPAVSLIELTQLLDWPREARLETSTNSAPASIRWAVAARSISRISRSEALPAFRVRQPSRKTVRYSSSGKRPSMNSNTSEL
jgi:hypothetical protein